MPRADRITAYTTGIKAYVNLLAVSQLHQHPDLTTTPTPHPLDIQLLITSLT